MSFFCEVIDQNLSGVAYKNISLKRSIVAHFSKNGNCTIADLCEEIGLSTPKINDVLNELTAEGLVKDYGKLHSRGGRRPNVYGLVGHYGYFLGVDVKRANINICINDLNKNLAFTKIDIPFTLRNDQEALDELCEIIEDYIKELPFDKSKILGVGLSMPGRINNHTGQSFNSFRFEIDDKAISLQDLISAKLSLQVFLENDSRAMCLGEFSAGVAVGYQNVLFLNLEHGMGVGIIVGGELYYGKSGFAGEFGHIPFFDNEIICNCGKKGCLETEVSGWALIRKFKEKLSKGHSSILSYKQGDDIKLTDIVNAAKKEDVLAIELITEIGEKLGKGIAVLINIFNPEMVVLGGTLSQTGDYLRIPIKSALNKYSLSLVNNDTPIELSTLGEKSGSIGACLLASKHLIDLTK